MNSSYSHKAYHRQIRHGSVTFSSRYPRNVYKSEVTKKFKDQESIFFETVPSWRCYNTKLEVLQYQAGGVRIFQFYWSNFWKNHSSIPFLTTEIVSEFAGISCTIWLAVWSKFNGTSLIVLMAEIPNNHLRCIKPVVK